jgi:hypothetical protein
MTGPSCGLRGPVRIPFAPDLVTGGSERNGRQL